MRHNDTINTWDYYTEDTYKKLVEIGFYEDKQYQYLKVNGKEHPNLPDINELVNWLRENMNIYIVIEPHSSYTHSSEDIDFSINFRYRIYHVNFTNQSPILLDDGDKGNGCYEICLGDNYLSATYYAVMKYLDYHFKNKENNKEIIKKLYNHEQQ